MTDDPHHPFLRRVLRDSLHVTMNRVVALLDEVPLAHWNEAAFRFHLTQAISKASPDIAQLTEAGRIDLVLRTASETAFIECKLYHRRRRLDPYTGAQTGWKGGPSRQNREEFQRSVDRLAHRPDHPGLARYLIVVFAEPPPTLGGPQRRFSDYLSPYARPTPGVAVTEQDRATYHRLGRNSECTGA